ncbi:MAG TPA: trehalose-6-phosphate synthase [Burkholderiales bacterium]|nr:trehalose-6-phosphate synthase [Burkholderiales bacterium]
MAIGARLPLSLRFVVPLALALAAIAYAVVPVVDRLTFQWFVRDLDMRGAVILQTAQDPLVELLQSGRGARERVLRYFDRMAEGQRIFALGFCDPKGKLMYATRVFPEAVRCAGGERRAPRNFVLELADGALHVSANPIVADGALLGELMIVHDMSFAQRRSADTRKYVLWLFAGIAAVVALITVIIAEISWRGWVAGIKAVLSGDYLLRSPTATAKASELRPELRPIARDLQALVNDLESERRARDESQTTWGPEALRRILRQDLKGDEILIVSNREPYLHVRRKDNVIEIQRPASGLVTALEPVMRACSGTWIAHGAGSADRETVDRHDHVMVPPEKPSYRIRRVWLSQEEEQGYYYGFANEGLWPLCHIAHTRPTFRAPDWEHYQTVNRRFADVVADEARTDDPIVLVQDYHFALLPRMVRERLPRATIITFWHIPWPNPEAFGICPWREEVLEGMLGSSILGFHTQFHCNNFFDTVDRFLEARVDRETFTISYGGDPTEVRRYPISIEWPPSALALQPPVAECRLRVRERLGLHPDVRLGVGVDRLDYTKGILERFAALERLFELEPRWIGQFSFIQAAAPSRISIDEYQNLEARVRSVAARINERFGRPGCLPIVLRIEHHDAAQVYEMYRAADLCYVSSLHDGMNLVAKEFVAARDDERGVLLLSQFTGAARDLAEALIVNPYDIEQSAAAMHLALTMSPEEQRARMRSMRNLVQEFNVYRWAGRMLLDAARMRHRSRVMARARAARRRSSALA